MKKQKRVERRKKVFPSSLKGTLNVNFVVFNRTERNFRGNAQRILHAPFHR